jgi:hypothetical protein
VVRLLADGADRCASCVSRLRRARFKTPFSIAIITPADNKAVSNAQLLVKAPAKDGRVRYEFSPTLPLPTYLVAIAVGPLDIVDAPAVAPNDIRSKPLPLRGVATRGQGSKLALTLRETPELVRRLEQYFGIAYPYPKLDLIASPDMGGAMENPGAILFDDTLILLAPDAPLQQILEFGEVTAHEIAHHWVGDLVTPVWWDDLWLNESFAEWSGIKIADQWRPDLGLRTSLIVDALGAMNVDSQRAGRPIRESIADNTRIASAFDSITYDKGGGVLAMFESYMGEEVFQRGVHQHLLAHPHGNATAQDFFSALARAAGQPAIVDAFRTFVEQPGVPLITVRTSADGRRLELAQARYRPLGSTIPPGGEWKVPFCAAFLGPAKPQKRCTLITGPSATLEVPTDMKVSAVMPNAGGAGYYRFAMAPAAVDSLLGLASRCLRGRPCARRQSRCRVPGRRPEPRQAPGRRRSTQRHQTASGGRVGAYAHRSQDRVLDAAQRRMMERKLSVIYGPRLHALGFDPRVGAHDREPAEQQLLRVSLLRILALGARDPAVRSVLLQAARASLTDPAALDTSIRDIAWGVAAQEDGVFAESLIKMFPQTQDGLLRQHAAAALGLSEQPATATRVRALAIDPGTRIYEMYSMLGGQFSSPSMREEAWQWLRDNYEAVLQRLPGSSQSPTFEFPDGFCDSGHRKELDTFLTPRPASSAWVARARPHARTRRSMRSPEGNARHRYSRGSRRLGSLNGAQGGGPIKSRFPSSRPLCRSRAYAVAAWK